MAQRPKRIAGALLGIVAIVFIAEMAVMGILVAAGLNPGDPRIALLDGLLLALLVAAPVYWLMVLPVHREHHKRLEAEYRARELDRLAMTDALTGVLKRRGIFARLLEAMAHAERYRRRLSVAMADLDRFKAVNDERGHAFGDAILRQVVGELAATLRASDLIGRVGGDEFLVILPETELALAVAWAERTRRRVERTIFGVEGVEVRLAVSIGACELDPGERLDELLARADGALYCAKREGHETGAGAVHASPDPGLHSCVG